MTLGALALGLLLTDGARALLFNLTADSSSCADAFQTLPSVGGQLLPLYHPVTGKYVTDNCTLSTAGVAFTDQSFSFLQLMGGGTVTSLKLRRTIGETDLTSVGHVVLPYACTGSVQGVTFLVPFVDSSATGCFAWPDLLAQANNTAKGLLTFASADRQTIFYYLAGGLACGRGEIQKALGTVGYLPSLAQLPDAVSPLNTNCETTGIEPSDTFLNGIGWNFCFWILFCTLLVLGGYTVISESEVAPDAKMKDNWRTHYPPYSLHFAASPHYTKHARLVLLAVSWAALICFQAGLLRAFPAMNRAVQLVLLPLCAALAALPFGLLGSALLARAYATNRAFVQQMRGVESVDERLHVREGWERRQYRAYFLFYIVAALLIGGFLLGGIVLLEGFPHQLQGWWLLSIVLAAGWVLLVQEPLLALLAKRSPACDRLLRRRGYWFDYDTAAQIEAFHLQ